MESAKDTLRSWAINLDQYMYEDLFTWDEGTVSLTYHDETKTRCYQLRSGDCLDYRKCSLHAAAGPNTENYFISIYCTGRGGGVDAGYCY